MWILCAIIGVFQLIILLMLSGILFSIAAVSRLMEITVILIYPTALFFLRQSANLIIFLTILTVKMTSSAFHQLWTLVKCDNPVPLSEEPSHTPIVAPIQYDLQAPFVPYKRTVLEESPEELRSKNIFSEAKDDGIIEPSDEQSQATPTDEEMISNTADTTTDL